MGVNLDYLIDVNVCTAAATVAATDFGKIAIISEDALFASGTSKDYNSAAEVAADAELTTSDLKAFVTSFFAQSRHPGSVTVIECPTGAGAYATDLDAWEAEAGVGAAYALVTDARTDADILACSTWANARRMVCFVQSADADILSDTTPNALSAITDLSHARTLFSYHATAAEPMDLAGAAMMLATDPDEGVPSYPYHTLTDVAVDALTATQRGNCLDNYANVYLNFHGVGATFGGKSCSGAFLDAQISADWLAARIEEGIAQLLLDVAARGGRVPYTDAGIAQIAAVVRTWMARGETIGHLRPGSSVVTVPAVADIAPATIAGRTLTITGSAILAGAIDQGVTVNIGVTSS